MRRRSSLVFFAAIALFLTPASALCATVNIGLISFDVLIPGDIGTPGVNVFNISNFTGDPLFVPSAGAPPSAKVTSIGGIPVPASPTGSFVVPDVVVNSGAALTVFVEAKNIPRGTKVSLIFYTENAPDQTILTGDLSVASDALTTASASVTLAPGYSKGYAKANWVQ